MFSDKNVLTIDDSSTIRSFLGSLLKAHGATVYEASDGQEALAQVGKNIHYDLILLDLLLPDIDGIAILKKIRETNEESSIVMLTGMGGIRSATAAVREGADGYIQKQDLSVGGDHVEFFYALRQAMEHRVGLVAQKQLQAIKTDFYSMVTHDLRNPTGSILLSLELLLDGGAGDLSEDQRELLGIALAAAKKTSSLINDYLDFAKIDAGYLRIEPKACELRKILEDSTRLSEMQAQSRQQTLTLDLPDRPVSGWLDCERLKQVFENLISNAIKYTPKGGRITVSLEKLEDRAVIKISDTGMGIKPNLLPTLFSKYHRISGSHTRTIQGTGLGLFIVKEIVEAHGGSVRAESEGIPGQGTTFIVDIPLSPPRKI